MLAEGANDNSNNVASRATFGDVLGVFCAALISSCFILCSCAWIAWGELFCGWLIALVISSICMVVYCYKKRNGDDKPASQSLYIVVGVAVVCALVSVLIPYVLNFSELPSLATQTSREIASSEGLGALVLRARLGLYGGGSSYVPDILLSTGIYGVLSGSIIMAIGAIPAFVSDAIERCRG